MRHTLEDPDLRSIYDAQTSYHLEKLLAVQARREAAEQRDSRHRLFSLARAIDRMGAATVGGDSRTGYVISGNMLDGVEREYLQEVARATGQPFDPMRPIIPWAYFCGARSVETIAQDMIAGFAWQRDLTKASPGGGGYLVSSTTRDAIDALRPYSVLTRMGITIEAALTDNLVFPKTTVHATAMWLTNEGTAITESTPTLDQIVLSPKHAGAFVEFSRLLAKQSNAEAYVSRELLRTVGTLVDVALLAGTGLTGQPTGLLNTAGIGSQSGTTLNIAGIAALKSDVANANAPDEQIAYLTTPDIRELLEARIATGSDNFLWKDDRVGSKPGYVSNVVPAATMICGAWSELIFASWGPGFEFALNPNDPTGFKQGIVQARVMVACDVGVSHAAAFSKADTIT